MPRFVSSAIKNRLNKRLATKPILNITIYWDDTFFTKYSTTDRILEVGPISVSKREDSSGAIGTASIKLDDFDGSLKFLMHNYQLEGSTCYIEMLFADTGTDSVPMIQGIVTDILWLEGERQLSFTIESDTFSDEIGFAPSIAQFPFLNPDAEQIPIPFVFGTPAHVPAVHVIHRLEGYLESHIKLTSDVYETTTTVHTYTNTTPDLTNAISEVIAGTADTVTSVTKIDLVDSCDVLSYEFDEEESTDFTGEQVTDIIYIRNGELFPQGKEVVISIEDVLFRGTFDGNEFSVVEANCAKYSGIEIDDRDATDSDFKNAHVCWIKGNYNLVNCHCYINSTEPNPKPLYNRCVKQEFNKCWFANPFIAHNGKIFLPDTIRQFTAVYPIERSGVLGNVSEYFYSFVSVLWFLGSRANIPYASILQHIKSIIEQNGFWQAFEETPVFLWNENESEIYVCNLIPSQAIRAVYAYRRVGEERLFSPVPSSYYTKYYNYPLFGTTQLAPFNTTALALTKPLSDYKDQGWEDEIYVTITSTVGPNPVDVIVWILEQFTGVTIDAATFNYVRSRVANYPVNFCLIEKENALRVAQRIAWESRCALSVINNVALLYYLPNIPAPILTLDESNIEEKSIEVKFSEMSEIITRLTLGYKDSYKPRPARAFLDSKRRQKIDNQHLLIGSQNVNIYGVIQEKKDIISYNIANYVTTTGNFWLNRMSNSWMRVKLNTFLQGTLLLPFDGVFLNVKQDLNYASFAVVESASFNFQDKTTTLELLLPITQGSSFIDSNFWTTVEIISPQINPATKYKEIDYDKQTVSLSSTPSLPDYASRATIPGTIVSTNPPPEHETEANNPVGSDSVTVNVQGQGNSQPPTQASQLGYSKDSDAVRFPGERVKVAPPQKGTVEILSSVDDKVVRVTGSNSEFGIGFYVGKMFSLGEIYKYLGKDPTQDLDLIEVPEQGINVLILNVAETLENAGNPLSQFPTWFPCRTIEKYENGIIVVSIFYQSENFPGRIVAVESGFPVWDYTVQAVINFNDAFSGPNKWVTDGVDISATNRAEFAGTPPYIYGNGNLITSSSGQVDSGSCIIVNIGTGCVPDVRMIINSDRLPTYSFCVSNSSKATS